VVAGRCYSQRMRWRTTVRSFQVERPSSVSASERAAIAIVYSTMSG
jgi:hypothetical protein